MILHGLLSVQFFAVFCNFAHSAHSVMLLAFIFALKRGKSCYIAIIKGKSNSPEEKEILYGTHKKNAESNGH